ncbi:MAG: hypothetical protein M3N53_07425 [Actinomycetota bacterium]|nr:hypothetical protein [Actinomycetota bacterium]
MLTTTTLRVVYAVFSAVAATERWGCFTRTLLDSKRRALICGDDSYLWVRAIVRGECHGGFRRAS